MARDQYISFRASPAERELLDRLVERVGVETHSALLRELITAAGRTYGLHKPRRLRRLELPVTNRAA